MNFQFYKEKLFASKEFEDFKKEFPDAFFTSGFFSIDKERKEQDQSHLDFYVPSVKKLFSFKLETGLEKLPLEIIEGQEFVKISDGINFDFDEVEKLIEKEMETQGVKNKIQKFIYSLQGRATPLGVPQDTEYRGKEFLITTVFISGFGILKVVIDVKENKIASFEKKSFMDFLKVGGKKKDSTSEQ
jgi:hypothetical protein